MSRTFDHFYEPEDEERVLTPEEIQEKERLEYLEWYNQNKNVNNNNQNKNENGN